MYTCLKVTPQAVAEKDNVIAQLRSAIKTKELIIEQVEEEKKELTQPLEDKLFDLQKELAQKDQQLQFIVSRNRLILFYGYEYNIDTLNTFINWFCYNL